MSQYCWASDEGSTEETLKRNSDSLLTSISRTMIRGIDTGYVAIIGKVTDIYIIFVV